jgi:hypothetical protein
VIDVVFYFQVHQPYRLRKWKPSDRIKKLDYFDTGSTASSPSASPSAATCR